MSLNSRLLIRPVQEGELPLLHELAYSTFVTAFGAHNTAANMAAYTQVYLSLAYITDLFHKAGVKFYIAWIDEQAVAYLQLNTGEAQNEQLLENAMELERIYVHHNSQGKGLGLQLLEFAVEQGRAQGKEWLWLGVWDQNHAAIRFYERHGFSTFSQHDFMLGQDRQRDWLMKRKL